MRVIDRAALMAAPAGTIYTHATMCAMSGLYVKGDTIDTPSGDWFELDLLWIDDEEPQDITTFFCKRESFPINTCEGRNGAFDHRDIFVVYDVADLRALRKHINWAITLATVGNLEDVK